MQLSTRFPPLSYSFILLILPPVGEAISAVSKSTELFLHYLVRNSLDIMNMNNRKMIKMEDLLIMSQCNKSRRQLEFLDDAFGPIQ